MKNIVKIAWYSVVIGVIATAFLDLWNMLRHYVFDVPLTKYEFIGRWMLYMLDGKFYHASIKQSPAINGELLAGWVGHYAIGVAFAVILLMLCGLKWLQSPKLKSAMLVSMATVVIPYFVMQPGMGLGIAGSASPDQVATIMKVIISHIVFGFGLYVAGLVFMRFVTRHSPKLSS